MSRALKPNPYYFSSKPQDRCKRLPLCPKCGHELKQGDLSCIFCGFKVPHGQVSPISTQQPSHVVARPLELVRVHGGTVRIDNEKLFLYRGKVGGEVKGLLNLTDIAQVTSETKVKRGQLLSGIFALIAGLASAYFAIVNHSVPSFSPLLKAITPYELFYSLTIVLLLGGLLNISDAIHGRLRITWIDHSGRTFKVEAGRRAAKRLVDATWFMSPSAKGAFPQVSTIQLGKPPKKHRDGFKLASATLATFGGILIVISGYGTSTSSYITEALNFAARHLGTSGNSAFVNFISVAIGGVSVAGILVVAGGIEMFLNHERLGKLLLEIGGLVGLFAIAATLSPYLLAGDVLYIFANWDKWIGLPLVAASKYVY
jgi:hypothetical protein